MAEFLPVILLVWFFTFLVTRKSRGRSELFKGYFLYLCSGMSEGDPPPVLTALPELHKMIFTPTLMPECRF